MISRFFHLVASAFGLVSLSCSSLTVVRVDGNAMLPTYKDGDRVVIKKDAGPIERGDVVIFRYPNDTSKMYIKRVIGLPGETISITAGKVTIDGKELDEPYVDPAHSRSDDNLEPTTIPPDSYFVMGDNRANSSDSRYWGTLGKEFIVGKCFLTY